MQIVKAGAAYSDAFIIQPGKQLTLNAQGLAGDDYVAIEIVTLSKAPEFKGNPCCDMQGGNIEVIGATPLMCAVDAPVQLTVDFPYVVIDTPQSVTLRAAVYSDPSALVTVDLHETGSNGSATPCRCQSTVWTPTGDVRCVGGSVEAKEESNCGVFRWVATGTVTWTPTGDVRCNNHLVENKEVSTCGDIRWVATTTPCGYCPSIGVKTCEGDLIGYAFHLEDPKDPAATLEIGLCTDEPTDSMWVYPSAGAGHTVKVMDCDGTLLGYFANQSDCSTPCGC